MSDNYQSPYGFGVVTDAVIDNIGENAGLDTNELIRLLDGLSEDQRRELEYRVDEEWWRDMAYARERLEALLSEYIPLWAEETP